MTTYKNSYTNNLYKMKYTTPLQNLLNNSKKHPNKAFLHQPIHRVWHSFTCLDVENQARRIAAGLKAQGYIQGDKIGIFSSNCAEWIIADLAIMMAGMVSVPIYAASEKETVNYITRHCDTKAVFIGVLDNPLVIESAIAPSILKIIFPYSIISNSNHSTLNKKWNDWLVDYAPLQDINQPKLDDVATIVYTSGSTNIPKGVVLTHKNIAIATQHFAKKINAKSEDRHISYLPLAHLTERSIIEYLSLYVDNEIYFIESTKTFKDDVKYAKPSFFLSVPHLWILLQSEILQLLPPKKYNFLLKVPFFGGCIKHKIRKEMGWSHVKTFGTGSAPISASLLHWYAQLGINICEGWGLTETGGVMCIHSPFNVKQIGTIGLSTGAAQIKISDEQEILVRGDSIFKEYYKDIKTTQDSFINGWLKTGDCGQIVDGHYVKIIGRIKEQFKTSKGKYIAPASIEALLLSSGFNNGVINQVCVLGTGLKQPIALIVINKQFKTKKALVDQFLTSIIKNTNEQLEKHKRLNFLFVCNDDWTTKNNLLTSTLKLKRGNIEKKYTSLINTQPTCNILWESE